MQNALAVALTPAVPPLAPRCNAAALGELEQADNGPAPMLHSRHSALAAADLVAPDVRVSRLSRSEGHATPARTHPEVSVLALTTYAAPAIPRLAPMSAADERAPATARGAARAATEQLPPEAPQVATHRDGRDHLGRQADARPSELEPERKRQAPLVPHAAVLGIERTPGEVGEGATPAPVPPLGQQVGDAVAQAVAGPRAPDWEQAAARGAPRKGEALRLLDVSLEPAELGSVRVRLALREANLRVELEAARPETGRLLGVEQMDIGERLEAAGYALESLTISTADSTPAERIARGAPDVTGIGLGQPRFGTPQSGRETNGETRQPPRPAGAKPEAGLPPHETVSGLYV